MESGFGGVELPHALAVKYPNAAFELGWQYVFPASKPSRDLRSNVLRRHHLDRSVLSKALRTAALKLGLTKRVGPHTLRHSFATHLLENGHNIKQVQELLGHKDIRTTMICLHAMEGGTTNVRSPLDSLLGKQP